VCLCECVKTYENYEKFPRVYTHTKRYCSFIHLATIRTEYKIPSLAHHPHSTLFLLLLHAGCKLHSGDWFIDCFLAHSAKLPTLLALIFFLSLFYLFLKWFRGEQLSKDLLDRFSQSFHRMKAFWVQMIDKDLFLSQGTLPWQPILWKNGKLPTFVALAFRNVMGYCYLNVHINSINNASISCKISWNSVQ